MIAARSDSTASRMFIATLAAASDRQSSTGIALRRREKCVLESWLKSADFGFADSKSRANLRLGGAKKLDVDLAGIAQRIAHGFERERGRIAIAAKMTKHDPVDFSRKQFFDDARGCIIRKVSVARLDPLFHRPGAMGIVLQKFFIVIRLNDERVHVAEPLDDHFGRITEIRDESKAARSGIKREADRIDRIVRDGKSLDGDVADFELGSGAKNSPVPISI